MVPEVFRMERTPFSTAQLLASTVKTENVFLVLNTRVGSGDAKELPAYFSHSIIGVSGIPYRKKNFRNICIQVRSRNVCKILNTYFH